MQIYQIFIPELGTGVKFKVLSPLKLKSLSEAQKEKIKKRF
jgi:hypothetical protein